MEERMRIQQAAQIFAELGNKTRLEILRLLVKSGQEGASIGEIQGHLNMPASTLAFHLRGLVAVGLVTQQKEGRTVRCQVRYDRITNAVDFLTRECCMGLERSTVAEEAAA